MSTAQPCLRSATEVSTLIRSLRKEIRCSGPHTPEEIKQLEAIFDLRLPRDYHQFLGKYGALFADGLAIFGLGEPEQTGLPVADAILMLRLAHPDIPLALAPIEELGEGRFACIVCGQQKRNYSPVIEIDTTRPLPLAKLAQLAPCFRDYLYNRLSQLDKRQTVDLALAVLEKHVEAFQAKFQYDRAEGGRLPRNYDWRPYRFCVQDVLLAATVVRHSRELNCLEVDVFLTADIPEYQPGSGAKALSVFLLSEAFKCGGTMEIRFTLNVEDGRVPAALQEVTLEAGVRLAHKRRIMPDESRELFLALTEFSPALQQRIEALDRAGMLSVERACYAVHHGVWTRPELESIILGSPYPDSILGGRALPEQRHLFLEDLLHARAAVLGGCLDRKLAKRDVSPEADRVIELEDTERRIEIQFEPQAYAKRYRCHEETLPVPWLADDGVQAEPIQPGDWLIALIRARDMADLRRYFGRDLEMAERLATAPSPNGAPHRVVVLVPHEFDELPPQECQDWVNAARKGTIGIMVCPETAASLDADVARRLARSRILRQ